METPLDIVARLRRYYPSNPEKENDLYRTIQEAADEIERLRAALNDMLSVCDRGAHDRHDIYRACDRARATLEPKP